MKIEHLAIWVKDLERMRLFYETYFQGKKNFRSYFISFKEGCKLELMNSQAIPPNLNDLSKQHEGIIHFAISVGSKEIVDSLTHKLRNDGYKIIGQPRTTGDGCYESLILDPENNRLEITV